MQALIREVGYILIAHIVILKQQTLLQIKEKVQYFDKRVDV